MLSEAIKNSFKLGAKRAWVHTCSLDHPHAINNYKSRGMKIFKSEILKEQFNNDNLDCILSKKWKHLDKIINICVLLF